MPRILVREPAGAAISRDQFAPERRLDVRLQRARVRTSRTGPRTHCSRRGTAPAGKAAWSARPQNTGLRCGPITGDPACGIAAGPCAS